VVHSLAGLHRSPPRNCSHKALPFVETAAKAKLAGSIETDARHHLAALPALRVVGVPITPIMFNRT
jgi:hypothetical protein